MLKKISKSDFDRLCENAEILEEDRYGPKVCLLPDGLILKTFRRKKLFSSQIWMSYATRFAQNAYLLKQRDVPTVTIKTTYKIPEIERHAVLYPLLEGETLREWMTGQDDSQILVLLEKFGHFIADLHQKGILFRSLHLGNVLVLKNGEFGLIDISDMSCRWRGPLSLRQRIRNFHHMDRYDEDRYALSGKRGQRFIDAYLKAASLPVNKTLVLRENYETIFSRYADQ